MENNAFLSSFPSGTSQAFGKAQDQNLGSALTYEKFAAEFAALPLSSLVASFNSQVGNRGWSSSRAVIETMDLAQHTNTIGALSAEDVSRTITASTVLAGRATQAAERPQRVVVENSVDNSASVATMQNVADVIGSLKQRLDAPFITVNSVTGELGIKQAQDEYARLIRNKTPKSRR